MSKDVTFLAQVVEHVGHPVFVKDRSGGFVFVNDAFAAMTRVAKSDFPGKTDHDFFPTHEADFFRQKDIEVFATGAPVHIEEEPFTDSSGDRHILATTKAPLIDEHGQVTHVVGIIHDITELKLVQKQLEAMNAELERSVAERTAALEAAQEKALRSERLAVLGHLAGGVAHQLRNPLSSILNAVAILERQTLSGDAAEALEILRAEAWRADGIVGDLLSYARVRQPDKRQTNLAELVTHVVRGEASDELLVELDVPEDLDVEVDGRQVTEALSNLLRNAREAMKGRGRVRVTARPERPFVVLTVQDDGPGVPEDARTRIFDPLFTTKQDGFGLGLSTARNLVASQGGTLTCVESGPDGTRFEVRLPVARPQ